MIDSPQLRFRNHSSCELSKRDVHYRRLITTTYPVLVCYRRPSCLSLIQRVVVAISPQYKETRQYIYGNVTTIWYIFEHGF